jgi:integrase
VPDSGRRQRAPSRAPNTEFAQVFQLAELVGRRPVGNIRKLPGGGYRRGNFNRQASWPHAVRAIGAEGLNFHDLRHTRNAWAAGSGVGSET